MSDTPIIEVCIDSVASAIAAEEGGAARVELCQNLFEGGTTPSIGTVHHALERVGIKVNAIIRPRGGDFLYSDDEFAVMQRDLVALKEMGINGAVIGLLNADGTIDTERSRQLIDLARPLDRRGAFGGVDHLEVDQDRPAGNDEAEPVDAEGAHCCLFCTAAECQLAKLLRQVLSGRSCTQ